MHEMSLKIEQIVNILVNIVNKYTVYITHFHRFIKNGFNKKLTLLVNNELLDFNKPVIIFKPKKYITKHFNRKYIIHKSNKVTKTCS